MAGALGANTAAALAVEDRTLAHNYSPLPVVIASGSGATVTDVDGRTYLDGLAAYSAVNFGHGNPRLLTAARDQLDRVTLTSRAFVTDRLGPFATALTELTGTEMMLPMNTGAEAVESAIKVARAWGYRVKGVPQGQATVIVASGNFHGRTTTIISFSDDPSARADFGPYTPGFRTVPYGDASALRDAMDDTVVAVLLEPIQGEGGVVIPPADYLPAVRAVCDEFGALFIADEIQSGLGRTGHTLAVQRVGVTPDLITLGKALGGGIVPVSAVVGRADVLGVLRPGEHGSTFGGNPLAAAVGTEVVAMLAEGTFQQRALDGEPVLRGYLDELMDEGVVAHRVAGLWAGIDIDPALGTGKEVAADLADRGVLVKDTHGSTIRFAPPLVVTDEEIGTAMQALGAVLRAPATRGA
ncbi:ornithine--oxo-acid transaminase [Curtobacterium sp. MCJR17_055]|uniref:ornithine--oxo-acid transaminase n=1 Tax=unclassified Curtobacterium TaxID=257496 RepID=UPI000D978336|nr:MULTISPECIES: ornithine--oxo-acid transaminase [unclassified Curtobacterium]PYY38000.1 ornithine--oxo-acid transaminase [Curtobacterium sp. MCBD17_029]PYY57214.1 ornithine--oxo-acid transaminase [Curtobacterium sp. MCJR17_055]PYY62058.1 ornithine--oxo-acid transaminase [Curtobacterium sp. MCPF17_015]